MVHRHLNHRDLTPAAIDDIISRGKRRDWAALRTALLADPAARDRVWRICQARVADPYAQRYHFWKHYADLRTRFDQVLAELESVAGRQTARVNRPVQILGSLDGIDTGVRQLIRDEPLEVTQVAQPLPYDLEETRLAEYKNLDPRWHDWRVVRAWCVRCADLIFDRITGLED